MTSMATFAKIDKYGFLLTPYRKVQKGAVTNDIVYLAADEEERYNIAHSTVDMDEKGNILDENVEIRYAGLSLLLLKVLILSMITTVDLDLP